MVRSWSVCILVKWLVLVSGERHILAERAEVCRWPCLQLAILLLSFDESETRCSNTELLTDFWVWKRGKKDALSVGRMHGRLRHTQVLDLLYLLHRCAETIQP
jgi:hypothetical protein